MRLSRALPRTLLTTVGVAAGIGFAAAPASAEPAIAITDVDQPTQSVVAFDTASPGDTTSVRLTGLAPRERIVAIDKRPATGVVYALGSQNRLYTLNPATGALTNTRFPRFQIFGAGPFGFDFNPVPDRLRTVSATTRNLRSNVGTGGTTRDMNLTYVAGDPAAGRTPRIVAAAYTNNNPGATTTTLYDIDSALNTLAVQAPPNDGLLTTRGRLGININDKASFDISGATGTAYAILSSPGSLGRLYTIDLTTGQANLVGPVGTSGTEYVGLTILPASHAQAR